MVWIVAAVAAPVLEVGGACPEVTFELSGLTPGAPIAFIGSDAPGSDPIPGGPCAGTITGLSAPQFLFQFVAPGPSVAFTPTFPLGACDKWVEVVDVSSCAASGSTTVTPTEEPECPSDGPLLWVSGGGLDTYDGVLGGAPLPGVGASATGGVAVGADCRLYVVAGSGVDAVDLATGEVTSFVAPGAGGLDLPRAIAFGPDGHLYVSDRRRDAVARFDGATGVHIDTPILEEAAIDDPVGLAFAADGTLYVGAENAQHVARFDAGFGLMEIAADPSVQVGSIAFHPDGDLLVSSRGGNSVLRYAPSGDVALGEFVSSGDGGLDEPIGLAFGPDGHLYVVSNHEGDGDLDGDILRFDGATGAFVDTFAAGGARSPLYLAFTP